MKNYNINLVKEGGSWFCNLVITKNCKEFNSWAWGDSANSAFSLALDRQC